MNIEPIQRDTVDKFTLFSKQPKIIVINCIDVWLELLYNITFKWAWLLNAFPNFA